MFWNLSFWDFGKIWGFFFKIKEVLCNFWDGFWIFNQKLHAFSSVLYMLNCLCADRFGLGAAHDAISFACHMYMHPYAYVLIFQYTCYISTVWGFSDCLFLPRLSLLFTLIVSMAPKRKSNPSQNSLLSGASSSSDPTPSYIRFHDEDA